MAAGLIYGLAGPWARLAAVTVEGTHYIDAARLEERLAELRGRSLLAIDTERIAAELERLPAVAGARADAELPDRLRVTVTEHPPAVVWQTAAARLVATADGALVASLPLDAPLPAELAGVPLVDDSRRASERLAVGGSLPVEAMATVRGLASIDPATLGSTATALAIRIEEDYGYVLVAGGPAWQAVFGYYGLEPEEGIETIEQRLTAQAAAVRTLFASRPEATVAWLDARNPGKVYFRASDG